MVQGVSALNRRLMSIPQKVRVEVVAQMEKEANKLVQEMRSLRPAREIIIDWTWGDAPAGSVTIGQVGQNRFGKIAITVYATARKNGRAFPNLAAWFEFGTGPRSQRKTGRYTGVMPASPYFFPVYRANRSRIRGSISRAVTRGVKKA